MPRPTTRARTTTPGGSATRRQSFGTAGSTSACSSAWPYSSAAAVGGGSIVYANLSAVPDQSLFKSGWPPEITWEALAPHYETVGRIMNVQKVPDNQWPKRTYLMQDGANAIGAGNRFEKLEVAVTFDPDWTYDRPDPFNVKNSKRFVNAHGVEQGTCVHLGNCDIGCEVDARNTLDRNYLAIAERHRAEVRPLHLVTSIEPIAGGYEVYFDRLVERRRLPRDRDSTAGRAGGRLDRLHRDAAALPRRRRVPDEAQSAPRLQLEQQRRFPHPRLLSQPRGAADAGADHHQRHQLPRRQPAGRQSFWIQDGGFPNVVANWLSRGATAADVRAQAFLQFATAAMRQFGPLENVMPWFAQGIDAANGRLSMRRRWWLVGQRRLDLDWDVTQSAKVIEAIIATHKELSKATGGTAVVPPSWTIDKFLITPHPLGGCNMGTSPASGVVDHKGEAFGHRNLFVLDGSIVPEALGVNPSRSIAALTERAIGIVIKDGR